MKMIVFDMNDVLTLVKLKYLKFNRFRERNPLNL
jgi:hypothetical protein